MNQTKAIIPVSLFFVFAALIFSSCSKEVEVIESNFVNYTDGQRISFSDAEGESFAAEVSLIESGYVILDFDGKLPDLHVQTDGYYVKHWMDLGETIAAPSIYGFNEDIDGNGPNGFADFGQYTSNITLNEKEYRDVASAFVWADTIRYDVHSQRGKGIIGISDFDNRKGFQIAIREWISE